MSAKYIMQEMKDLNQEGEVLLYPRMVLRTVCETDELVRMASNNSTFGASEMRGIIGHLADWMAMVMAQGRPVRLEGIGLFTPTLALKEGKEREAADGSGTRRNAQSVRVGGLSFKPDKGLVNEVNSQCELSREPGRYALRVSRYTADERLALAQRYLERNPFLTVSDYAALTGLSQTTASRELRRWRETPGSGIGFTGRGSHRIYIKKEEES